MFARFTGEVEAEARRMRDGFSCSLRRLLSGGKTFPSVMAKCQHSGCQTTVSWRKEVLGAHTQKTKELVAKVGGDYLSALAGGPWG